MRLFVRPAFALSVAVALAGTLLLAACGGGKPTSADVSTAKSAGAAKVSANTASKAELAQAFDTAGIPEAERWAGEVQEYRPYPADDPDFGKLRHELAKYHPAADVVDKIVATLKA